MIRFRQRNLEKAIKVIEKPAPDMAKAIMEAPDSDWIVPFKSRNGWPNMMVKEGARLRTVYDVEDSRKGPREMAEQYACHKEIMNIIIGSGYGYLIDILIRKGERGHKVVLVEPNYQMLRLAFSLHDFSQPLVDGRLSLTVDAMGAASVIGLLDNMQPFEGFNVLQEPYVQYRPDEYMRIKNAVVHTINSIMCNVGTVSGAGLQMAENDIVSLPYVIRHRGVAELQDMFKGKPAICVATGPSLERNIHMLKDLKPSAIIVAVAQALRPLLAYGIEPDFIVTVDFGKTNMGHFRGLMDSNIPLVCIARAYAELLKQWRGPKFVVGNPMPGNQECTQALLEKKGFLDSGGSVSHLAFTFALSMGCDPIILVGHDLAWTNKSHIPLADESGNVSMTQDGTLLWEVKDERSHLKGQPYNHGQAVEIPGFYGRPVLTNRGLLSFLNTFQSFAQMIKDRILINATEGGARIDGFRHMTLADTAKKYLKKWVTRKDLHKKLTPCEDAESLMREAVRRLEKEISALRIIVKQSCVTLKYHKKIQAYIDGKDQSRKALDENLKLAFEHGMQAQEVSKKIPLMVLSLYGPLRQIESRRYRAKKNWAALMQGKDDLKIRHERSCYIYREAIRCARHLLKLYRKTHKMLNKYLATHDESLLYDLENYIPTIDDAKMFFEAGNWARPYLDAIKMHGYCIDKISDKIQAVMDKAIKMRDESIKQSKDRKLEEDPAIIEYYDLMQESRKLGRQFKYEESLKLIRRAFKLVNGKKQFEQEQRHARWGIATTLSHLGKYDESDKWYKWLIEVYPDDPVYVFERGLNEIYRNRIKEGSEIIAPILNKVDRYDYFLVRIGDLNMELKAYDFAERAYNRYLESFPNDFYAWKRLSEAYEKQDKIEELNHAYKQWLSLNISSDELPQAIKTDK